MLFYLAKEPFQYREQINYEAAWHSSLFELKNRITLLYIAY